MYIHIIFEVFKDNDSCKKKINKYKKFELKSILSVYISRNMYQIYYIHMYLPELTINLASSGVCLDTSLIHIAACLRT
jgi:hypothetical protein